MTRYERLAELMERRGVDAVVLRRPANFAWYTGGADSRVDHVAPGGVADLIVWPGSELVLTSTIEAPRMRAEQTPDLEAAEHPWYEDRNAAVRELIGGGVRIGSDLGLAGTLDLSDDIARLRRTLDADAIDSLRGVGHDLSAAMAEAAAAVEPGITEHEAAAALARACRSRGLTATALLAAADERIARHRHPVPVGARIERRAMLVASAERGGLYANLTGIVELDEPDPEPAERLRVCKEATWPGRSLAEAFADCRAFYAYAGLPGEWRLHHQGGLTGYASRELIATPSTEDVIEPDQAFAWNPSVTGAKEDETFILTETGPEVVAGAAPAAV